MDPEEKSANRWIDIQLDVLAQNAFKFLSNEINSYYDAYPSLPSELISVNRCWKLNACFTLTKRDGNEGEDVLSQIAMKSLKHIYEEERCSERWTNYDAVQIRFIAWIQKSLQIWHCPMHKAKSFEITSQIRSEDLIAIIHIRQSCCLDCNFRWRHSSKIWH